MAMHVTESLLGVDVSRIEFVISQGPNIPLLRLANEPQSITQWLDSLPANPQCLALEATNTFHLELAMQAHKRGIRVYLIDGFRLNRYRDSVGGRAKTDASDAHLLWRYLQRKQCDLRPWEPPSEGYTAIQRLLHRRHTLVQARVALVQSLREFRELKSATRALLQQLDRIDRLIKSRLAQLIRHHHWHDKVVRCQAIEGVGPLTAAALVMSFHRGNFQTSDAYIAFLFLGLDVRESGSYRGRRKLTKKGDPELRGLSKIQALVILARKLARVAFALLKNNTTYQPRVTLEA